MEYEELCAILDLMQADEDQQPAQDAVLNSSYVDLGVGA
jgi:hypothetical protein